MCFPSSFPKSTAPKDVGLPRALPKPAISVKEACLTKAACEGCSHLGHYGVTTHILTYNLCATVKYVRVHRLITHLA